MWDMGDNALPASIVRAIGNKLYDRRKEAALELESLIKTLAAQVPDFRSVYLKDLIFVNMQSCVTWLSLYKAWAV